MLILLSIFCFFKFSQGVCISSPSMEAFEMEGDHLFWMTFYRLRRSSSDSAIEALAEALNGSDPILHPISPASLLDTQTSVLNTQESFQSANSSLIEEDDSTHSKNDKSKRYARRSTSVLETKNDIASKVLPHKFFWSLHIEFLAPLSCPDFGAQTRAWHIQGMIIKLINKCHPAIIIP